MGLSNASASPPSSVASRVSPETVGKAVDALLKWRNSKSKQQKPQLLEQDDLLYLILTLKKIPPKGRTNPFKIPLPNPLHSSDEELCLIIDDRSKSSLTSEAAKKKIKSENIPISKVLKLSKLKSDYRPFEAKRKLCDSFDLFFADKRIIPLLPRLLGKQFFKKKKIPIPVDLTHKNWKQQTENSCGSALLYLRTGTCCVLKVGRVSLGRDEIVANVVAAIDGVAEIVPKKWANVRSLHLKMSESLALPVYQSVPDMGLKIEGIKSKEENIEEELGKVVENEGNERVEEKLRKKKGSNKGRIHEVRYMDSNLDGLLDEDEMGSGKGVDDGETSENDELGSDDSKRSQKNDLGSAELAAKKRKKANRMKKEHVLKELNGEKRQKKSAKVKNGAAVKQKKGLSLASGEIVDDLPISGGVKKKEKNKLGKLQDGEMKMNDKKSKRNRATA
ncbi:hypothetical protein HHK36_032732 [Tetracentron sinense]|uniref:Ribosomal protein L1 n=1 Tax=Tetracentron sinense TaxID=13715 RepID=A0A835D057_TETSI|nr:hypothetical protein HHK36_032732 [Tetracentron sinense]